MVTDVRKFEKWVVASSTKLTEKEWEEIGDFLNGYKPEIPLQGECHTCQSFIHLTCKNADSPRYKSFDGNATCPLWTYREDFKHLYNK